MRSMIVSVISSLNLSSLNTGLLGPIPRKASPMTIVLDSMILMGFGMFQELFLDGLLAFFITTNDRRIWLFRLSFVNFALLTNSWWKLLEGKHFLSCIDCGQRTYARFSSLIDLRGSKILQWQPFLRVFSILLGTMENAIQNLILLGSELEGIGHSATRGMCAASIGIGVETDLPRKQRSRRKWSFEVP